MGGALRELPPRICTDTTRKWLFDGNSLSTPCRAFAKRVQRRWEALRELPPHLLQSKLIRLESPYCHCQSYAGRTRRKWQALHFEQ